VTPEDVAAELDVLASRVRRMSPPLSSDPERFHAQRSVIAHDLAELARRIAPRARRTSELEVELSERRRGRIVVATTQAINGRPVTVQ
jgi:hypothetical protein